MPHDWNLDQVPDLSGRVIIITGANSGIGYEAALAFAKRKADVVLACRNQDKARAAADRIPVFRHDMNKLLDSVKA